MLASRRLTSILRLASTLALPTGTPSIIPKQQRAQRTNKSWTRPPNHV